MSLSESNRKKQKERAIERDDGSSPSLHSVAADGTAGQDAVTRAHRDHVGRMVEVGDVLSGWLEHIEYLVH